ncbi:gp436 family protein [Brucella pseudogrignonensis]|uniref:gp436 family protein n=1 Tax=Brucella pseudogrignonensis TaxID=419475 RepID=UPI003ECE74E7
MSYASLEDLIERAGEDEILQIADRDLDGIADPDVIDAALVHADNIVNGYVSVQYELPFKAVPDLLRTWAVSIARYFLHRNGQDEHIVRDYKEALSSLKEIAAGRLKLPVGPDDPAPQPSSGSDVSIVGPEPVFTADKLKGWL